MLAKVERTSLLHTLQSVQPGLSMENVVSQSGSFVFQNGQILTYNEEVACRARSNLPPDFTGAVRAKAFIDLLSKLPDDVLTLDVDSDKLVIHGSGRRARLTMDRHITIPLDKLEKPNKEDWKVIHEEFNDAVKIVQNVAGSDPSQFIGMCIHITPNWVEAMDGFQLARYKLKTGVRESVLVKKDALKHVVPLDVTRVCETNKWIHFRNPAGVILSVKRNLDPFPDLKKHLEVNGTPAALPKGLDQAVKIASIFSKENADSNLLILSLKPKKEAKSGRNLMITGIGTSGDYSELGKVDYDGPSIAFTIPPEILTRVAEKHSECILTEKRLKVDGGKWCYVTSLGDVAAMIPKTTLKKEEESTKEEESDE